MTVIFPSFPTFWSPGVLDSSLSMSTEVWYAWPMPGMYGSSSEAANITWQLRQLQRKALEDFKRQKKTVRVRKSIPWYGMITQKMANFKLFNYVTGYVQVCSTWWSWCLKIWQLQLGTWCVVGVFILEENSCILVRSSWHRCTESIRCKDVSWCFCAPCISIVILQQSSIKNTQTML